MMLDLGTNDYNWAMTDASEGGHKGIVQMMLDSEADVAIGGYKEIVKMIKKYAQNF
jgi:hypothetical protein